MLCGVPVVKYSQALGTFKNGWNKFLAKWILPKIKLICARGKITQDNLAGIGVTENVKLCADGAFSMPDSEFYAEKVQKLCEDSPFFRKRVVALSISSVVQGKCEKMGRDYRGCMIQFINWLNEQDYNVLLIANAAREGSEKPRNNDLIICTEVYNAVRDKTKVMWEPREMAPEEIRELLARCEVLVASRFHAMIGALEKCTPVLLVGWSHKYKEVLDMFGLGEYAVDFSALELDSLKTKFMGFISESQNIREKIKENLPAVLESSRDNIRFISEEIDKVYAKPKKVKLLDFIRPEFYMGEHICARMGYAADGNIRANAASGGMVTALLCHMLETGEIDGAWVTRSEIKDGKLGYKTFIATTREELMESSSSVYMYMPLMKHVDMLREFNGKLAVVLVPCQMRAFTAMLEKEPALKEKVVLKLGLYCSGSHSENATLVPLRKKKISLEGAKRLYYRRGHWRGLSTVQYEDGSEKTPVVLHRAILGSLDRFMAYLIEETKGKFPTWLAPVQVKVLPVSEKTLEYAEAITEKLVEAGVRVALDDDNQKIGYKIRAAQQVDRVPYMLVLGAKEAEAGNISVRDRKGETTTMELDAFIAKVTDEIKNRTYNA